MQAAIAENKEALEKMREAAEHHDDHHGPAVTRQQMKDAKLPLGFRDNCAHLLIPLNQCRYDTYFLPWKCRDLFHDYEHCQHHEYERRVKVWKEKKANGEV